MSEQNQQGNQSFPTPVVSPSPVRASVVNLVDTISGMREFIDKRPDLDPDLKCYIGTELDELTSNAVRIDLHNVEAPGGGFDLHLSIRPFKLGAG